MNIKDKAAVFDCIKYMLKRDEDNYITKCELVELLTSNSFIHILSKYINNLKAIEINTNLEIPCTICGEDDHNAANHEIDNKGE